MAGASVQYTKVVTSSAVNPTAGAVIASLTLTDSSALSPNKPGAPSFYNNGASLIEISATQTAPGPINNLGIYINGVLRAPVFMKNAKDGSSYFGLLEEFYKNLTTPDDSVIEVKAEATAAASTYMVTIRVVPPGWIGFLGEIHNEGGGSTLPDVPQVANILGGSVINTNGGTIITIPAGRIWKGSVQLGACHTAAADFVASISVQGANAVPASGSIVCSVQGAVIGIPLTGTYSPGGVSVSDVYVSAPAGNAVTLQLNNPTASSAIGTANGLLL